MQTGASGDQRDQLVNVDTAPSWVRVDSTGAKLDSSNLALGTVYLYAFKVYAYPSDGSEHVPSTGDPKFGYTDFKEFWRACGAPPSPISLSATAPDTLTIVFGIPASPYGKPSASAAWHQEISELTAELSTTADFSSGVAATVTVPRPKPSTLNPLERDFDRKSARNTAFYKERVLHEISVEFYSNDSWHRVPCDHSPTFILGGHMRSRIEVTASDAWTDRPRYDLGAGWRLDTSFYRRPIAHGLNFLP